MPALLFLSAILAVSPLPAYATNTASVSAQSQGVLFSSCVSPCNTPAGTLTLTNGDYLVYQLAETCSSSSASSCSATTSITDSAGALFVPVFGAVVTGTFCAQYLGNGTCNITQAVRDEVWWAPITKSQAGVTITAHISGGSGTNGFFMNVLDVAGLVPYLVDTSSGTGGKNGSDSNHNSGNVNPNLSWDDTHNYLLLGAISGAAVYNSGLAGASYTAQKSAGSTENSMTEYATSPTSTNNVPWKCSGASCGSIGWFEAGFALEPLSVIPCTFFQLQCWWYPVLFFGVYITIFVAVARASEVDNKDYPGHVLEALAIASLLAVIMGMLNIMIPMLITAVQVIRAIRA